MSKELSVKQNAMYNTAGSLFYLVCQWLITVLVVRLSNYENAGMLSLCMSLTNMFFTIATFGLKDFQISDRENQFSPSQYLSTRILTCTAASLACLVSLIVAGNYSGYEIACVMTYMIFRVAEAIVDSLQSMEMKAGRMDYCFISFVLRGTTLLVGFSAVLYLTQNLLYAILCITITAFLVAILFDLMVCNRLHPLRFQFAPKVSGKLLWTCFPLVCNSFTLTAIVSIPRSTLEAQYGDYLMGIYSSIASPCTIMQSAATWLFTPVITTFTLYYQLKDRKRYLELSAKIWFLLLGFFAVVFVGAKILGRWGLNLLYGESILEYADLLIPVLGTTAMIACAYFASTLLTITRKMRVILVSNALAAVTAVVLSGPLIRQFGMNGVNFTIYAAMGINLLIQLVALLVISRRHFESDK